MPAEAATLALIDVMEELVATISRETDLVRSGRLQEAFRLNAAKTRVAQTYLLACERVKADATRLAPGPLRDRLCRCQDDLRAALEVNLRVLATAQAVSEDIIRGAAAEAARRSQPRTYGHAGRTTQSAAGTAHPVVMSRTL
jgi:hypothetical protein